jgi:hypothetical protein
MATFLLWLILLFLCWPVALLALFLYPVIWILTIPFRIIGITVEGIFIFLKEIILLPSKILQGLGKAR